MFSLSCGNVVINLYAKQLLGMDVCRSCRFQRLVPKGRGVQVDSHRGDVSVLGVI